jgi:hypothetical protein
MNRPRVPAAEKLHVVSLRLNNEQKAKLLRLAHAAGCISCAQWVREKIDKAKEPK